jgi:hypothetical protein
MVDNAQKLYLPKKISREDVEMKIISFSAIEILPKLLSKEKDQTIRPLKWTCNFCKEKFWSREECDNHIAEKSEVDKFYGNGNSTSTVYQQDIMEPMTRFKVGDKVKLVWKQRSKYGWFCDQCGRGIREESVENIREVENTNLPETCSVTDKSIKLFPKLLGTGTITEVFEIEIKRLDKLHWSIDTPNYHLIAQETLEIWDEIRELYTRDGFKNPMQMMLWLDKHYDLNTPKRFIVYRFKWD